MTARERAGLFISRWGPTIDSRTRPYNYQWLIINGQLSIIRWGGAGLFISRWGPTIDSRTRPYNYQWSIIKAIADAIIK
ncbi:hypothetical protein H6G70_18500 [Arthrospira platensis FACHB-439]|uniref:hypothetical protein n=1 Tax=Limnospira platensis TaxID=118562 RepID=UPI0002F929F5|nr:hypothetical protein [Arthrospira platensis FACHB-439]MBD2713360.1 hypothetical protein [Arthrospira platensis FACHB-835]QQW31679.1 hypothetical protein AP9108_15205 [Arthrospira sp. PCC 9108]